MKEIKYTYDFEKQNTNVCELIIENGLLNGEEFKINNVNFGVLKVIDVELDEKGHVPCKKCAFYKSVMCPILGCAIEDITKQGKLVVDKSQARMNLDEIKREWIGKTVCKKSLKTFKYGGKTGTVKDVVYPHPYKDDVIAFQIEEDGTFVEAWRCFDVEDTEKFGPRD